MESGPSEVFLYIEIMEFGKSVSTVITVSSTLVNIRVILQVKDCLQSITLVSICLAFLRSSG